MNKIVYINYSGKRSWTCSSANSFSSDVIGLEVDVRGLWKGPIGSSYVSKLKQREQNIYVIILGKIAM